MVAKACGRHLLPVLSLPGFCFCTFAPGFFFDLPADIICFLSFGSLVTFAPSPSSHVCSFSLFPLVFNVFFCCPSQMPFPFCIFQRLSFLLDVVSYLAELYREHIL
jgi:hypothetical protein